MADPFEKRLRRAEFLQKEWPFAADLLCFYRKIFALQSDLYRDLSAGAYPDATPLVPHMQRLLDLVSREGPPEIAHRAGSIPLGPLLVRYSDGESLEDPVLEFFPRVLQAAELAWMSDHRPPPTARESQRECPGCGKLPLVGLLREDKAAETVRRTLICSLCAHEWDFARVLCPACGEEKPEKLPRYSAQEIPWMRIEGCDTCGKYLKSVDLTLNWDAEPVVDELASTPLDVIAGEHGYAKIAPNLAGL
ncbi:MAG: formate dehydrogenase accessory protein FdhE [Planctomycetota bacterium]|nr:MAG: formate dehydrogenase accessory protein FdhE [Planctomycetota bacterium]